MSEPDLIAQVEKAVRISGGSAAMDGTGTAELDDVELTHIQPVAATLARDPLLKEVQGKYVEDGCGFGHTVSLDRLAQWLIYRAGVIGPGTAVNEAKEFVESNEAEMLNVLALGGIRPSTDVLLAQGMELMPLDGLPPSPQRDAALGDTRSSLLQLQPLRPFPSAALIARHTLKPVFRSSSRPSRVEAEARERRDLLLRRTRLCLAIIYKGCVDAVAEWSQPASPHTSWIFPKSMITFSGAWPIRREPSTLAIPAHLKETVKRLLSFSDPPSLDVALERLNFAMSGYRRVDRAIDLGIALESLLMHTGNMKDSNKQETGYKFRLRGAWLLAPVPDARKDLIGVFKDLYNLRSQAVHSGQLQIKPDKIKECDELLSRGEDLCADIIYRLLEMGNWPDWDALVLGA
jgi:hypothetical protein